MSTKSQFFKIIVVGDPGVGKTSFIQRYCNEQWYSDELSLKESSIGMDFHLKGITMSDGKPCALQLWDIAGQDRNFEVSKVFIRDAIGCVVVCDAERKETLDNALKWKQKIDSSCDRVEDKPIPCILMQNKSDLLPKDGRQGFQNQENLVLTGVDAQFIGTSQVSAKTNTGIDAAMKTLIEAVTAFNAKKMIASKQNKSSSVEDSLKAGTKDEKKGPIKLNQQPKKSQEKSNCC